MLFLVVPMQHGDTHDYTPYIDWLVHLAYVGAYGIGYTIEHSGICYTSSSMRLTPIVTTTNINSQWHPTGSELFEGHFFL